MGASRSRVAERTEPLQDDGATPGTEPAARVPTSGRRDGNVAEKSPGPSGLRGADTDTATTVRQRADRPGSSNDVPMYEETLPETDDDDVRAPSDTRLFYTSDADDVPLYVYLCGS